MTNFITGREEWYNGWTKALEETGELINTYKLMFCNLRYVVRMALKTLKPMMTSSNANIFRVTGPLCGEFTGHRWIPFTKASDASFDVFFDMHLNKWLSKQSRRRWFETPSHSLWRHCIDRDAYIRQWTRSLLIPVRACRLSVPNHHSN